jgi:arylformamidase
MEKQHIIELSHRMMPGNDPHRLETRLYDVTQVMPHVKHRADVRYVMGEVTFSTHAGTHIEFPFHHGQGGPGPADFPIERLIGEAVVLDFSHKAHQEAITLDEVKAHAARIRQGDIIFIRTDMDRHFYTDRCFEHPYLTAEAMEWLVAQKPKVVGTDAAGFEVPGTDYQPNHQMLFRHNVPMVEFATNLAQIGEERALVFILPLPIDGMDASPVRIVALRRAAWPVQ